MAGLIYTPTGWVEEVTSTSAANMNNLEAGVQQGIGLKADFCFDANIDVTAAPGSPFDGVTYALNPVGLRFLLIGQTNTAQNGLWQHNGAGNAMTRPAEFPSGLVAPDGLRISVKQGKTYGGAILTLNNGRIDAAFTATVGTDGLTFLRPPPPAVGAWTPLTLLNSWTPLGGTWPVPAYLKDPMGQVHFRGAMQGGAFNDTPAFTMPPNYRVPGDASSGAHLIFATGGGLGIAHFRGTGDFNPFTGSAWIDLTNARYWPTQ